MTKLTFDKLNETPNSRNEIAKKRHRIGAFLIDFFIFWFVGMILDIFMEHQTKPALDIA